MHLVALRRAGVGLLLHKGVPPRGYLPYGLQLTARCSLLWGTPPVQHTLQSSDVGSAASKAFPILLLCPVGCSSVLAAAF